MLADSQPTATRSAREAAWPARRGKGMPPAKIAELEAVFEKAANEPTTRKFLDDAREQLLIRKGAALRQYIDKEYDVLGKLAKALNLSPQ